MSLFPRSLESATRIEEIFDSAYYFEQRSPRLLHQFEYFNSVRDYAAAYLDSGEDLRRDFEGARAWSQGNDVDPNLTEDREHPTQGMICDNMMYFGFNTIFIQRWDQISRLTQPSSETSHFFQWLAYPHG